jgi:hypothetical protein
MVMMCSPAQRIRACFAIVPESTVVARVSSGAILGLASGHTLWLDANAAGRGWFYPTPFDDAEFTTPAGHPRSGSQGEQDRMDLLTALAHELGHLLGRDHEADGLMAQTLTAGTRRAPSSGSVPMDVALDRMFADGQTSLAAPFAAELILQTTL